MGPEDEATVPSDDGSRITRLTASNYNIWKIRMKFALTEKQLWNYVDETATVPPRGTPRQLDAYSRQDARALSRISQGVSDDYLFLVQNATSARDAWLRIERHFENRGAGQLRELRRRLLTTKMTERSQAGLGHEQRMEQHLSFMRGLASQLAGMGYNVSEAEFVDAVLESLPESYRVVVSTLAAQPEKVLTEDYVMSRLKAEARRKDTGRPQENGHRRQEKGDQVVLHTQGTQKRCYYCNIRGHLQHDCEKRMRDLGQQHTGGGEASRGRGRGRGRGLGRGGFGARPGNQRGQGTRGNGATLMASITNSALSQDEERSAWLVDSGATTHMSPRREWMVNYTPFPEPREVQMGNDHSLDAMGYGTIMVRMTQLPTGTLEVELTNVWYVPELRKNLLSVPVITKHGGQVLFKKEKCTILKGKTVLATARMLPNQQLYKLNCKTEARDGPSEADKLRAGALATEGQKDCNKLQLWHDRLGHVSHRNLRSMKFHQCVEGLEFDEDERGEFCDACATGKQSREPRNKFPGQRATERLELVHTDVCGPMPTESPQGKRYFLLFVDDFSRYTVAYFLRNKSEVVEKLKEYEALVTNQTGLRLKQIRSDNGREYVNEEFEQFCKQRGILHQKTVPQNPNMNGVAERANRTVVEAARAMLHKAHMAQTFWAEAVNTAVYIKNRVLTKAVKAKTPFEAWFQRKPSIKHMRIFGAKAYAHIPDEFRRKFDRKTKLCRLLGYEANGGYRLYDPEDRKVIISRDVRFDEAYADRAKDKAGEEAEPAKAVDEAEAGEAIEEAEPEEAVEEVEQEETEKPAPRRSERLKEKQKKGDQNPGARAFVMEQSDPTTVSDALSRPDAGKWKEALGKEYASLMDNGTWALVELPEGRKAIGCKWVLKIKRNPDGSVNKYKARLVIKGYAQKYGIDYNETYAPVMQLTSLRTLIALATARGMYMEHMDVETAFLNAELEEDIYMEQPQEYQVAGKEHLVCKLKRSLYGLKQAPRCWNKNVDSFLKDAGFISSEADPCVYIRGENGKLSIIGLFVDDCLIITDAEQDLKRVKQEFQSRYKMSDLGKLHYILGLEVVRQGDATFVNQAKYASEVLKRFGMENCKPVSTPREANEYLPRDAGEAIDQTKYQALIGSLMYLALGTRPDIANAVGAAAQFCSDPRTEHWAAAKRILRYLQGTTVYGILFSHAEGSSKLIGYVDADWAGDKTDRRSTSGYMFFFGGPISWASRKQTTVALSTAEAEYAAASGATQELIWLRRLLESLHVPQSQTTPLYIDNQSAIAMTKNPVNHARAKHIEIKLHFIRDAYSKGLVNPIYCPSTDNISDILTKGLGKQAYEKHREAMHVCKQPQQGPTPSKPNLKKASASIARGYAEERRGARTRLTRDASGHSMLLWTLLFLVLPMTSFLVRAQTNTVPGTKVATYQYCGGERLGATQIKIEDLKTYGPYAELDPTMAVRQALKRTDIAATEDLIDKNALTVWNCTKIHGIVMYREDQASKGKDYQKMDRYPQIKDVATGNQLYKNDDGELQAYAPPSFGYYTAAGEIPRTEAERRLLRKWKEPLYDAEFIKRMAATVGALEDGLGLLAQLANERSIGDPFPRGELTPVTHRTEEANAYYLNLLLRGEIQLVINLTVVVIALCHVIRFIYLFCTCFKCITECCACFFQFCRCRQESNATEPRQRRQEAAELGRMLD